MLDVFRPPAVKAVLAALAALRFGIHESTIAPYKASAARVIRNSPRRTAQTLDDTKNPAGVALLVLLNELECDIATGRHHVYRGMLGTGGGFLTAAHVEIVRQLREAKTISDEEVDLAMKNLREAIKAGG
ncbi:MAG: hypothetical protein JNJ63_01675 [Hyphomonadaceae bacterium]|nr:hypothetical protein [Hyphomonadaceae bacterium]